MAKDYRKEISFQAGELSPRFFGRSDTEFYQRGLAKARNVVIDKRGGAFRRRGARNRGQVPVTANDVRVFTKQIHAFRFDTILIYESEMMVIAPGIDFQSANLLSNPKFDDDSNWTVAQDSSASRAIFRNNICILKPQQNNGEQKVSIRQQATVTASTSDSHTVRIQQAKTRLLRIKIGTTEQGTEIADVYDDDELIEFTFTPNNATYWVEIESDGDTSLGSELVFVGTLATADVGGLGITYTAPWEERQIEDIHIIQSPTGEKLYFLHPNVEPQVLEYDFATDAYTAVAAVTFTSPPAEWTGTNWPSTGTVFEGRLWLAATPNEPQTVWASVSGTLESFSTGSGADKGWNFTRQKQGRIKWLLGTKDLIIGAEDGEHIVTSEGGVLTQDDFKIQQQSSYGSDNNQAIQIGEKVFYTTADGRKVQSMSYAWQEDNWLSLDVTFASEHVTEGIVSRRFWAQNPNSEYGLVLNDGDMAILTYERTAEVAAWALHEFDGMEVKDVAVGEIGGTSRIVYGVQRTADEIEIEIEPSENVYMDSFSHTYHEPASDTLDGLDHLEGETVQVVVDGAVSESQTVSSGSITAADSGNSIYAGKQIESMIKTLPPDTQGESIRSWKKRWNQVYALMYQSPPPIINGTRPPDRSPSTPMGQPEPFTDDAYPVITLGWDENGQVTIEEDLPVPSNVLSIYGQFSRESL